MRHPIDPPMPSPDAACSLSPLRACRACHLCQGELGSGNMTLRPNTSVDTKEEDQVEVQFEVQVKVQI